MLITPIVIGLLLLGAAIAGFRIWAKNFNRMNQNFTKDGHLIHHTEYPENRFVEPDYSQEEHKRAS